jgi:hypothetical protein
MLLIVFFDGTQDGTHFDELRSRADDVEELHRYQDFSSSLRNSCKVFKVLGVLFHAECKNLLGFS